LYAAAISYFLYLDDLEFSYFLRHLAFFYYALFFFAGYKLGPEMIQRLSRYWIPILAGVILTTCFVGGGLGSAMALGFVWLVCQKGRPDKRVFYLYWAGMSFLFLMVSHHGTSKALLILLVCSAPVIYLLKLWNKTNVAMLNKASLRFFLLIVTVLLVVGANHLIDMMYAVAAAGGSFHAFFEDFGFTDMNGVWRIMLWTYLFDRFLDHPLGIGLGTPLIGRELANFMYLVQKPGDEFTSGAHNSFLTFLVRLGVPFLIYFLCMSSFAGQLILRFLRRTGYRVLDTVEKRFVFSTLLTFLIAVIQACFNVVLESPLTAGLFWFYFGLFVRVTGDFLAAPRENASC
ncbi:MAG: O-antigen ligase family protein, partial [Deltaproteobacteria bacterium]|nr:O-antigen ligase family protein [Deltaproteobacteria bacterium]